MTYKDTNIYIYILYIYNHVILLRWCSASAHFYMGVRFDVYSPAPKTVHNQQKNTIQNKQRRTKTWNCRNGSSPINFLIFFINFFGWLYLCCTYLNAAAEIHTNILGFIDALTFALTFASNKSHKTM